MKLPDKINIVDETDCSARHQYSSVMIDESGLVLYRQENYEGAGVGESWLDDPVWYAYDLDIWRETFDEMTGVDKRNISRCCGHEWDGVVNASNIDDYIAYFGLDAMVDRLPICTMFEFLEKERALQGFMTAIMTVNEAILHTINKLTEEEKKALNDEHNWIVGERVLRCHTLGDVGSHQYESGLQYWGDIFMIIEAEKMMKSDNPEIAHKYSELYRGLTQIIEEEKTCPTP